MEANVDKSENSNHPGHMLSCCCEKVIPLQPRGNSASFQGETASRNGSRLSESWQTLLSREVVEYLAGLEGGCFLFWQFCRNACGPFPETLPSPPLSHALRRAFGPTGQPQAPKTNMVQPRPAGDHADLQLNPFVCLMERHLAWVRGRTKEFICELPGSLEEDPKPGSENGHLGVGGGGS